MNQSSIVNGKKPIARLVIQKNKANKNKKNKKVSDSLEKKMDNFQEANGQFESKITEGEILEYLITKIGYSLITLL